MGGWTQSICDTCWPAYCFGRGEIPFNPSRVKSEYTEEETCVACGQVHESGIFVRLDPAIVEPFLKAQEQAQADDQD